MDSIWINGVQKPNFRTLNKKIKTDVLIVGGGITGILCAYMLKRAGVDYILAEAKEICCGITKNTTAKITLQHGLIYDKMIKRFGVESSRLFLEAQKKAVDEYSRLSKNIECDYELKDSYVYSLADREKIEKEIYALEKLGVNADFLETLSIPIDVAGAVRVRAQAQFHPLKFIFEIAKDLNIYENTKVLELMPNKAITENGEIECKKIIIATHFPVLNKHGGYFLKMYQHRSYVLALENAQNVGGMYVDENEKGLSFRNYNDILLLGGGSHRTGKKGGNWRELETFASKNYPKAAIVNKWATQDCMTLDDIPYIGKYSRGTQDLFVATGFNKWGMSSAMVSAMVLTDLVQDKNNAYASVFSPSRSILHPQLVINSIESLINILTPTTPRCPHLGCALKYNKEEHSWDCPCHGSRFTEKGELIDNPATDDKKI
ncbi:MAG: FAD-dependent oxidoreductase [Clostridia bacterium]|nr:FAD-dependent oxidoreductase [Clostridia bacterium]